MPLLKRKHVPLVPFPKELEDGSIAPDTEVFQLKATGEIFLHYEYVIPVHGNLGQCCPAARQATCSAFKLTYCRCCPSHLLSHPVGITPSA